MNENGLQTSFWVMIIVQTLGSVDMPGHGPRKMPSPRQYVAILVTWLVLELVAGINAGAEKATAAIGWALVLTGLVVGPFGRQVINLFSVVSTQFSSSSPVPAAQQAAGIPATSPISTLTPFPPSGVTLKP